MGHPNEEDLGVMNVIAMSAFYSPDERSELRIRLPFSIEDGRFDYETWDGWIALDPLRNVESSLDRLRGMKAILQVGKKDEFSLNLGMRGISSILKKNGVAHAYKEYDEGHFGIDYFYEYSLPSLISGLMG